MTKYTPVFILMDGTFLLRRKPNDLFAVDEMLFIWAFHRIYEVIVFSLHLICVKN